MVKRRVELIALCVVILLYTGILPVYNRNPFSCVLSEPSITSISGTVVSSPVKTSSGKSYSVVLSVTEVASKTTKAACLGKVTLYVPAADVEALYPGKLYSTAKVAGYSNGDSNKDSGANSDTESADVTIAEAAFSGTKNTPLIEEGCRLKAEVAYTGNADGDYLSLLSGNIERPAFSVKRITEISWDSVLPYIRAFLRLQLKRLLAAWGAAGGLLLALISGSREYTDSSISDAFRNAGLSHILALSGMHLSLFAGLSEKSAGKLAGKRFSPYLSLSAAFMFVWFAGVSPSLRRALICMCISCCASLFGFRTTPVKTLSLAFIIHLLISPEDSGSLAFMLSYLALCGVYAGNYLFTQKLSCVLPVRVSSALSASTGAQLFTLPITITSFGSVVPAAIIASAVVSPIASAFVTSGIVSIAFVLAMPFLLQPVGCIISMLYNVLSGIVRFFARIPCIRI
ncbi:MAG: ComEC/Rec2 family competence protein [Spirochaetaceae bacterium]|nr:ComEC/Rec2 family competence protein [Spirochaetaceae bacterium]